MIILGIMLILSATFLLRAYPGMNWLRSSNLTYVGQNDSWGFLNIVEGIRDNNNRIPEYYPNLLPRKPLSYPYFMHWLVSFLDEASVQKIRPFWGAIVETIHALVIMLFSYWLIGFSPAWDHIPILPGVILTGFIFAVFPYLLRSGHGPGLVFSPRSLGSLFLSISTLSVFGWQLSNQPIFVIISIVFLPLILYTHKFATQTLWFLYPAIAITTKNIDVVTVYFVSLCIAFGVGNYKVILHGHLAHLRRWMMLQFLPNWGLAINRHLVKILKDKKFDYLINLAPSSYKWFWTSDSTGPYFYIPIIILPLFLLLFEGPTQGTLFLFSWLLCIQFVHTLILIPGLRYVGDPGRYFEYSAPPVALLSVYTIFTLKSPLISEFSLSVAPIIAFLTLLGMSLLSIREVYVSKHIFLNKKKGESIENLRKWLENETQKNIMCIPAAECKYFLHSSPHQYVLTRASDHISQSRRQLMSETFEYLTVPTPDFDLHSRKFNLDYLIVNTELLKDIPVDYGLTSISPVFEAGDFEVYDIESILNEETKYE